MKTGFILIMGVSGSCKNSVGKALAIRLGWDSYDGDDFHPPANIEKMTRGIPLDDEDRRPWLAALHDLIAACLKEGRPGVLACSALKQSYRETLLAGNAGVQIIFLKGSYALIQARMASRPGHYYETRHAAEPVGGSRGAGRCSDHGYLLPIDGIVKKIVEELQ